VRVRRSSKHEHPRAFARSVANLFSRRDVAPIIRVGVRAPKSLFRGSQRKSPRLVVSAANKSGFAAPLSRRSQLMSISLSRVFVLLALAHSPAAFAQCATWDQAVGVPGVHGWVFALHAFDDGTGPALFAGGALDTAGGVSANNIAKWNGTIWSTLGSGLNGEADALQVFDDGSGPALYAGGNFTMAGGASANDIARWDGASWSSLGSGLSGPSHRVQALATFDDGSGPALYAGGLFFSAGGSPARSVARWNGASWSPLAGGLEGIVHALQVFDDGSGPALYAAGAFDVAGGVSANNIAKWNGTSWSTVGGGTERIVTALQVFDDGSGAALYAGGFFGVVGGTSANHVAKWDGTSWSSLGVGTSNRVTAMAVFDDGTDADADLFVGGFFAHAGGAPSNNVAKWQGCGTESFCSGDGSTVACPCANNGFAGHGCDNSASTGGARLIATGAASLARDSVLLTASGETPTASSIVAQGDTEISPAPFGQGLRCVAGNLKRLYVESAVGGAFSAPTGAEPSVHSRSASLGDTISAGSARYYFVYYRDPSVLGGCPSSSTFNVTQSLRLIWAP
jgi:hypothetical protein